MDRADQFRFAIPGYTPETIPLARLLEYLHQVFIILGSPEQIHLISIEQGSAQPVLRAPADVIVRSTDNAARVMRGDGSQPQNIAFNRIRHMLRADSPKWPARLTHRKRVILEIPPAPDDTGVLSGIRQETTIDGLLIRVGGAGENVSVQLQTSTGEIVSHLNVSRDIAKTLARLLFEPVRLQGDAAWGRTAEGKWFIERMRIKSFERLEDEDLTLTLERLRHADVKWPKDAVEKLQALREPAL